MKGLLLKDLLILKSRSKFVIILFLLGIAWLINDSSNTVFVTYYITFAFSYLTLNTISYDSFENGFPHLFSLPINRQTYVAEKYVLALLICSGSWVIAILMNLTFLSVTHQMAELDGFWFVGLMGLVLVLMLQGFSIPIQLKFGAEKGRIVTLIVMGVLGAALVVLNTGEIMVDGVVYSRLAYIIHYLGGFVDDYLTQSHSLTLLQGIVLLIPIMIFGISYPITVAIMKKKEY